MKYILSAALVMLAFWAWRRNRQGQAKNWPINSAKATNPAKDAAKPVTMLACGHCNMHFDAAEAVYGADATPFCSAKHLLLGQR